MSDHERASSPQRDGGLATGPSTTSAPEASPKALGLLWSLIACLGGELGHVALGHRAAPSGYVKVWRSGTEGTRDSDCHLHVEMPTGAVSLTERLWGELTPPTLPARHATRASTDISAGPQLGRFVWHIRHEDILGRWGSTLAFAEHVRTALRNVAEAGAAP